MARLKDIAERTGLSVNTVSLALRESSRIAGPTRERVRAVAHALDYLPNHAAKALVSRQTMAVGLLLTDVTSPLLTQVARSVERELKALGYVMLLAASNGDADEELRALDTLRARQVDGMLVYPDDHRRLDPVVRLRAGGMPVVLLAGDGAGAVDAVRIDERGGALRATRHLIAGGHRRIGLIDGPRSNGNALKSEGFVQAMEEADLPHGGDLAVDPRGHSVAHGHDAFARLMAARQPPTAVLAANDRLALGGLRWCQGAGVAVPRDLAVMGFDNIEYGEYASTPLSTVDYPAEALAQAAVARLQALIAAKGALPAPLTRAIDPGLVLRESTARAS